MKRIRVLVSLFINGKLTSKRHRRFTAFLNSKLHSGFVYVNVDGKLKAKVEGKEILKAGEQFMPSYSNYEVIGFGDVNDHETRWLIQDYL